MATITRIRGKKGTKFRAQVRIKGGPTLSATFSSRAKAKDWASQTETGIRDGRHFRAPEAHRKTLSNLIDRYLEEVNPQRPKSSRDRKHIQNPPERSGFFKSMGDRDFLKNISPGNLRVWNRISACLILQSTYILLQ